MPRLDHFSLIAPWYDRFLGGGDSARLRELLALPARRLLDVGGGTGRVSEALAGSSAQVIVADLSAGMLDRARARPGIEPVRAPAERLPFGDGAFDCIVVVDALHHFGDQRAAAAELLRVLAPGGRLVVQEMNYDRMGAKLIALAERLLLMGSHFFRPADLQRLFERPGVRVASHDDDSIDLWVVVEKTGQPGAGGRA